MADPSQGRRRRPGLGLGRHLRGAADDGGRPGGRHRVGLVLQLLRHRLDAVRRVASTTRPASWPTGCCERRAARAAGAPVPSRRARQSTPSERPRGSGCARCARRARRGDTARASRAGPGGHQRHAAGRRGAGAADHLHGGHAADRQRRGGRSAAHARTTSRKPDDGKDIIVSVTADKRFYMGSARLPTRDELAQRLIDAQRRSAPRRPSS